MPHVEPLREGDPAAVGAYRLAGRLGAGSQGVVYLAKAPNGAPVAVKVLHEGLAGGDRLAREMAAARQVEPVNVAQVLDASVSGRPYIVSEYVDGPSLQQAGRRTGAELHRLAVATATALAAIHRAGIAHRDFKPAGVLLGSGGPRVIGFGVTGALDSKLSATSNIVGTPAYMAPEQLAGQAVGPAADAFAWGSVVVFAATGTPPFGDDSLPAVINRILRSEPRLGELPQSLRAAVTRCLAKDPAARPAMHEVLLHLLGSPATQTAPAAAPSPAAPYAAPVSPDRSPAPPQSDRQRTDGPADRGPAATGPHTAGADRPMSPQGGAGHADADQWLTAPQAATWQEPISQSTDPVRPVTGPRGPTWPPAAAAWEDSYDTPEPTTPPPPGPARPGAPGAQSSGPQSSGPGASGPQSFGPQSFGPGAFASNAGDRDADDEWAFEEQAVGEGVPTPVAPGGPGTATTQMFDSRAFNPNAARHEAVDERGFAPGAGGRETYEERAFALSAAGSGHGEQVWPPVERPDDARRQEGARPSTAEPQQWPQETSGEPAPAKPRRRRGKTLVIAAASGLTAVALAGAIVWLTPSSPQPRSQSLVSASSGASPSASPTPSRKRPTRTRTPAPADHGATDPAATRSADVTGSPTTEAVAGRLRLSYVRALGTRNGTCWAGDQVTLTALVERGGERLPFGYVWLVDGRIIGRASTVVEEDGRLVVNAPRALTADGGTHLVTFRITTPVTRQRSLSLTFC
ncbi:protein kinase, partial [Nonomuraea sp. RK-328]|nr:protein kinase [Nonomuraea sp. RK-328]